MIVAWNRITCANTVAVAGGTLTNLPILNSTEALLLQPGSVVSLITWQGSWAILGRLVIPGTPEAASALSALALRTEAGSQSGTFTSSVGDFVDLPGAEPGPALEDVTVGGSGRLLVIVSCGVRVFIGGTGFSFDSGMGFAGFAIYNSAGATVRYGSDVDSFTVSAAFGEPAGGTGATGWTEVSGSKFALVEHLTPGAYKVAMKYRALVAGSAGSYVRFDYPILSTLPL
ncbi:hypothetical protein ACIBF5_09475 [Micromonospora sp. NPDC050417]|uniref:hypothetical protein n=1 Tax=Micromonospora sp. NPDC050417 TaxID=3364280 RepID=UPI0037A89CFB